MFDNLTWDAILQAWPWFGAAAVVFIAMLINFSQRMNARWLRRLSDLSQRHRTSLKYHHRLGLFPETA